MASEESVKMEAVVKAEEPVKAEPTEAVKTEAAKSEPMEAAVKAHQSTEEGGAAAGTNNPVDEDDRKLFAGGLPQEATESEIREHFSQYGEIESINLKTDQTTGRSRGFCFVVYKEVESLEMGVAEGNHVIKGKKVAVKKAQAKQGKIHVGKLRPEVTDDDIKEFFAQYGNIAGIEQPFDKMKNERKNFCFITYDREEPAKKLLKLAVVTIKGVELDINKVTPKPSMPGMFGGPGGPKGQGQPWGGFGGGGGGQWGGYGGGGGEYWGGYGAGGQGGYDQFGGGGGYGGGGGGWGGGYGGGGPAGWGGYGGGGGNQQGGFGGKAPMRGRGAPRGRGMRQKPY